MPRNSDALEIGYKLDEYVIVDVLGSGGFGITYHAIDPALQRHVAIKEYFPSQFAQRQGDNTIAARPDAENTELFKWGLDRFLSEARTLAQFEHPNIVKVTRYIQANGSAYLVMKFEEGRDLEAWLEEKKTPPTEAELSAIILPILDGLQAVHAQGLIHRDVKPANIMIRADATPILIDFGSARPSGRSNNTSLTAVISPGYSPPEQYGGDSSAQGPWTDIYALAGVMYRMLMGKGPADALNRVSGTQMPAAVDVGSGKATIEMLAAIDSGLAISAAARPQSVAEFRSQLLGDVPAHSGQPPAAAATPPAPGDDDATMKRDVPYARSDNVDAQTGSAQPAPPQPAASAAVTGTAPVAPVAKKSRAVMWLSLLVVLFAGTAGLLARNDLQLLVTNLLKADDPLLPPFEINTEPSDAQIAFLNIEKPYDPGMLLPAGRYRVELTAQGFKLERTWLDHSATTATHQIVMTVDPQPFSISVAQPGAKIQFLDLADNYSPGMLLAPDDYRLKVSARGYDDRSITVSHGRESTNFHADLERSLSPFTVLTEPSGATVRVLNIEPRYRPAMSLPPGDYRVEVSAQGYATKTVNFSHGLEATERRIELALLATACTVHHVDSDGKAGTFTGSCRNGKPYGTGRIDYDNSDTVTGNWKNGLLNGDAVYSFNGGNRYEGEFVDDKFNGQGTYFLAEGNRYEGAFRDDKFNGQGTYFFTSGNRYEGNFVDDYFKGQGIYYYADGSRYVGEFVEDKRHGQGTYFYVGGDRHVGENREDTFNGPGTYYYSNGSRYEGAFSNGNFNGQGIYYYANGDRYVGEFLEDNQHGQGIKYGANGDKQEGYFQDDELWNGQMYFASGSSCEIREHEPVVRDCMSWN